jgi:hypothetical protein
MDFLKTCATGENTSEIKKTGIVIQIYRFIIYYTLG